MYKRQVPTHCPQAAIQQQQQGADERHKQTLSKLGELAGSAEERHAQLTEKLETHQRYISKAEEMVRRGRRKHHSPAPPRGP